MCTFTLTSCAHAYHTKTHGKIIGTILRTKNPFRVSCLLEIRNEKDNLGVLGRTLGSVHSESVSRSANVCSFRIEAEKGICHSVLPSGWLPHTSASVCCTLAEELRHFISLGGEYSTNSAVHRNTMCCIIYRLNILHINSEINWYSSPVLSRNPITLQ